MLRERTPYILILILSLILMISANKIYDQRILLQSRNATILDLRLQLQIQLQNQQITQPNKVKSNLECVSWWYGNASLHDAKLQLCGNHIPAPSIATKALQ